MQSETNKNISLLFILLTAVITFYSCNSSETGPDDNLQPGRRDYVWTVDTLSKYGKYNGYCYMYGTSPSNIWCIGQGDYSDRFLHYDGTKWSLLKDVGAFDPWCVFGFSADDIWFGGNESSIWHYSNGKITKFGSYPIEGYGEAIIESFWGNSTNDIYASGCIFTPSHDKIYAILLHYDGSKWEYVVKPEMEMQFSQIKRGLKDSPDYFINGYKDNPFTGDTVALFRYDGKTVSRIYSEKLTTFTGVGILVLNERIYFGFKEKIFKYVNNQFVQLVDFSGNNVKHMSKLCGRNEKDIFVDLNGGIGHYNGSDLKPIYSYNSSTFIYETLLFEKDSYFLCYDGNKNLYLLIHGALK